jgi:acetylglutamate synthase
MVLQKQEDELKARVLRLARKNYNSLGTFIRLVDYMVTQTQVKINQESIELILYEMNTTKKYNINTQVNFDTNGLLFNPAKNEFITGFNKLLDEMENVANEVYRVITHLPFSQFIQGLISDGGGRFKDIVADSFRCRTAREAIASKIDSDFKALSTEVGRIELCRDVHEFT